MRVSSLITASVLALSTATASAETVCGATAIPNGSEWFLVIHSTITTTCDMEFIGSRGQFRGNCMVIDDQVDGEPVVQYSTVSGRFIINSTCGVRGTATFVEEDQSQQVQLNGQLWSADRTVNTRPTAGGGVAAAPNVSGVAGLVPWEIIRRAWDNTFPYIPSGN